MAFVVTEACIRCRFTDCVKVCPVDAFHAGEQMLVINPEVCIDCAVCEPACPTHAIEPASERNQRWLQLNQRLAQVWPLITEQIEPLPDADKHIEETNKFESHFSEKPLGPF